MSNTEIPAQEVELDTKRQRLFHVTWLNRIRLDKQLRPLLAEFERTSNDGKMGVLARATFRGAVTLINHYLHFDIREHPSAIFLILLKLMDDRSFDNIWNTYKPIIVWVDDNGLSEETHLLSQASNGFTPEQGVIQFNTSSQLPDVGVRDARIRQDHLLQDTTGESSRSTSDSDTGQQA